MTRGATRARPTLKGRVSRLALAVIAGWLIVLAVGFDLVLFARVDSQIDDALRVRAEAGSATVEMDGSRIVGVRESATDTQLDSSIWVFAGTRALERPSVRAGVQRAARAAASRPRGYTEDAGHRFYVLPVTAGGVRSGSVVAAVDLDPYEDTRHTILIGSAVVVVLLLAGAYPVLQLSTRRALEPVDRMTRQAADWSVTSPGERFGENQKYVELETLAGNLDGLLDRLAAVLRHERQLSAELSHELRTPIARMAAQVDLMLNRATAEQREELEAIRENCTSMDTIIDALLAAARSELATGVGRCELAPVFATLIDQDNASQLRAEPTTLAVGVERDVVLRILSPLIDNARRFAVRQITLAARRVDRGVVIEVADDGAALDPELAERIFEPGFHAGAGHDGAGLGLALARRLARSADGDLDVDASAERTTFRVSLPKG